ncbi:MAG: 2Fe-2S iron-sulfur cluster-binding protein [Planctomycetota bacterium]|jgi:NADH dehydrogenase/NADH:ubiquinone oxidoreductase subunit G
MISLTIDNKKIEVEEGSTVLQAAEKLGIKIPTRFLLSATISR